MANEAKRIKLDPKVDIDDGEVSYDILEWFPVLVCQNVFKYLNGKDIIRASGVNKEWNKLCAEAHQIKKLKLVVGKSQEIMLTDETMQVLKNSKRCHQNIVFQRTSSEEIRSFLQFFEQGSWKSVEFSDSQVEPEVWFKMMQAIEAGINELSLNGWLTDEVMSSVTNWTFPCLKRLRVDLSETKHIQHFARCSTLVKFAFNLDWGYTPDIERNLLTMLNKNRNLEEISILNFDAAFEHSFPFKLKKLEIALERDSPEMLLSFLRTQSQTLESLALDSELNQEQMEFVLRMPKLTFLGIGGYVCDEPELPVNTTIQSLSLENVVEGITPLAFIILLRSLATLKKIRCDRICDRKFQSLAREAPNLETFEALFFDVTHFSRDNMFPRIRKFEVRVFDRALQEPTNDSNFSKMVREQMRKNV